MILYNCHTEGDRWRITKFNDGELESTYICTPIECECPAGVRPSCRHRQMLPQMLAHHIQDSMWFMDWDRSGAIVDFNGASKRLYDDLQRLLPNELAATPVLPTEQDTKPQPLPLTVRLRDDEGPPLPQMIAQRRAQWRRL